MIRCKLASIVVGLTLAASLSFAQEEKPLSPAGTAATQVGGEWTKDMLRHSGGKWLEVTYSRPILRGRENVFGSGADYGKTVTGRAPVWRAGANATTKLKTEVPLEIAGKKIPAGEYDVFIDLKEGGWTLILSTQPTQAKHDPKDKSATWGSFGYDPKYDVVRAPMQMSKLQQSFDQFTIAFVDMTDKGGKLAFIWGKDEALINFSVGQ